MDSTDSTGKFGTDRIEVGQDMPTATNSQAMIMADIPIAPKQNYMMQMLKDILSQTPTPNKGCNSCHNSEGTANVKDENMNNLMARLSGPIATFGKSANGLNNGNPPDEELAPYVINEQDPNLLAETKAKIMSLMLAGKNVNYKGSDNMALTKLNQQNLAMACACIMADTMNGNKIAAAAKIADNAPKDQMGNKNPNGLGVNTVVNNNVDEGVLLALCNNLNTYQMNNSCGKDAPSPGSQNACLGVLGGGKFQNMLTGEVSILTLDVSGNALVTAGQLTFTNVAGDVEAFNYKTHTLINTVTFQSLTGTMSGSDVTLTGLGTASVNGSSSPTNIELVASSVAGIVTFQILDLDQSSTVLAGGIGVLNLASLSINQ
jgi:hypothetical protein